MKNIALLLLTTVLVFGQYDWQDNGLPVRQGVHIEWQRSGDSGNSDEMLFAWSDTRGGVRDIFAQKVTSDGTKLWGDLGVPVVIAEGRQEDPILVSDGAGGAFFIWIDYRYEPEDGDIFAQHLNSEGLIDTLIWGATGTPLTTVPGKQVSPNMCVDGLGGAFVIWDDNSVSNSGQIYAQHLTTAGALEDPATAGFPIITSSGSHTGVSIEVSGTGFANMAWAQSVGEFSDIYAQRIDTACNTLWSTPEEGGIVVCDAVNNQNKPKINDLSSEISVVVWEDERLLQQETDIYIQYIDTDGNMLLNDNGEVVCSAAGSQITPRVKAADGSAYVIWADKRYSSQWDDIYMQKYDISGSAQWEADGRAVALTGQTKSGPRLTTDGQGGVYAIWMDERNASFPEVDIYLQHYDADGTQTFQDDGLVICDADNTQFSPLIRPDGSGGALMIWGDWRSGSQGLYLQHVDNPGGITLMENGLELYFGIDGNGVSPQALYLGNNSTLLYWTDFRFGGSYPVIYGQIIDDSYDVFDASNGTIMGTQGTYQVNPHAALIGDHIFLNYETVDQWGTFLQYYLIFDLNLNLLSDPAGSPVYLAAWQFNQEYSAVVTGEDGYVYLAFSDMRLFDYEVYVQKYDADGIRQWADGGVLLAELGGTDDIVKDIEALPGGGCIVVWQGGNWDDQNIYAQAVDNAGDIETGWPEDGIEISAVANNQTNPVSTRTDEGIMVVWKDSRNANADVYAQYVNFTGDILGEAGGFPVSDKPLDQQDVELTFNPVENEVLVCWEDYENGLDFDIFCNTYDPAANSLGDEFPVSNISGSNENNPFLLTSQDGTYMIAWEDTRESTTKDIYYQEFKNGAPVFAENGIYVVHTAFKQENPGIGLMSETSNSYLLFWDDSRSSGKEDLINIYVQSRTLEQNACGSMDPNFDETVDILDVVMTVGYIMGTHEFTEDQICASDANTDGTVDILDVVTMVNYIVGIGG